MDRLKGKVAIVTGAAGGIGAAIAERFLAEGARVVLGDLSEKDLRHAAQRFDPERVALCETDVRKAEDIERCTGVAIEAFGGLDIMVANAGIEGLVSPITEYPV